MRDLSRKQRTAIRAKGESSRPTTNCAIYGYKKVSGDKYSWHIDEEAAENRRCECVCGNCGSAFTTTRKDVKYCCDECRTESNRKTRHERYETENETRIEPTALDVSPRTEAGQEPKTA